MKLIKSVNNRAFIRAPLIQVLFEHSWFGQRICTAVSICGTSETGRLRNQKSIFSSPISVAVLR